LVAFNKIPTLGFVLLIGKSVYILKKISDKNKIYTNKIMKVKEIMAEGLFIFILFINFIISVT
jgi:hypothetical protein